MADAVKPAAPPSSAPMGLGDDPSSSQALVDWLAHQRSVLPSARGHGQQRVRAAIGAKAAPRIGSAYRTRVGRMKYRVHELASEAGVTSREVLRTLVDLGEFAKSPSSSVSEPVANRVLAALRARNATNATSGGVPARPMASSSKLTSRGLATPATTYTWQANPVREPSNSDVVRNVETLEAEFPVAAQHRAMLQALGSQFVYAKTVPAGDGKQLGVALARFSGAIEAAFGITREVMFFYSPFYDLQIRTFTRAKEILQNLPREATPDLVFFASPDDRMTIKLGDWSTLGFSAIPLQSNLDSTPLEIIRLLRDHVYARDLFYETTPVRGDKFFGRKALLQELKDDIVNQRVSGIFGLRKSGKTSVLQQVGELLDSNSLVTVFVDLEVLPSPPEDPTESLIKALASRIRARLRDHETVSKALERASAKPTPDMLREAMEDVLDALSKKKINLVLLLDEIEFLTPTDQLDVAEGPFAGVAQTLGVLRSLVQGTDNFTFLLSGLTTDILESGRLYGRPNPLFSWAKARYVGPFSSAEADELATAIGARMGIEIEAGALRALYDGSGGHAYLYRNLASAVVAELPVVTYRRVMKVSDVLHQLMPWKRSIAGNLDEIFGHLERYYPNESVLLDILLEDPEEFPVIATHEDRAIHHLMSLGLLSESQGIYEPSLILELR